MNDQPRPESAAIRQILIFLALVLAGGVIGFAVFGHGWSQELNVIVISVLLASAAALVPRLSRWIRSRWGPGEP